LCDADSVVLPVSNITAYLERALERLRLHVEARTSFITYAACSSSIRGVQLTSFYLFRFWLPSFMKYGYIALRFIPQATYSETATLDIIPKPDVITRIFMVFKGVSDAQGWPSARQRAEDDVSIWIHVVGIDPATMGNKELHRALEWGAMEVPS
jgi:hypothetical protein